MSEQRGQSIKEIAATLARDHPYEYASLLYLRIYGSIERPAEQLMRMFLRDRVYRNTPGDLLSMVHLVRELSLGWEFLRDHPYFSQFIREE